MEERGDVVDYGAGVVFGSVELGDLMTSEHLWAVGESLVGRVEVESVMLRVFVQMLLAEG